ncbi:MULTISPECIES: PAAR domain-containing protein [unclassified Caballeronia]|uniref:PAAR domain-containing protein n=1 Tax=unclassified Caballeronia TaxID=2646786 RepID=UPI002028DCE8|nr:MULTISPECIES: PAAR domain-containing protein [unclassified Caballeronia]MDR5765524.1 PAAR domain-containing protein [Caballeronia sp. LZ028]
MTDRLVGKGDWTTTRGRVLGGSSSFFAENGQTLSRRNDIATCGNCEGGFPILGTADTILDEGLPLVKHLDRVLCPCGQNRVLSGHSEFLIRDGKGEGTRSTTGGGSTAFSSAPFPSFDERFQLLDRKTGEPLANFEYAIERTGGEIEHGVTDENGRTHLLSCTANAESIHIYI